MGYAIAKMAANRGADVTLVSGPTNIEPPSNIKKLIKVQSAKDMYDAIIDNLMKSSHNKKCSCSRL